MYQVYDLALKDLSKVYAHTYIKWILKELSYNESTIYQLYTMEQQIKNPTQRQE